MEIHEPQQGMNFECCTAFNVVPVTLIAFLHLSFRHCVSEFPSSRLATKSSAAVSNLRQTLPTYELSLRQMSALELVLRNDSNATSVFI